MIAHDDIEAFADDSEDDIKAALRYAQRYQRGLPPDRWSKGSKGAEAVARGIVALWRMQEATAAAFTNLYAETVKASAEAMELSPARAQPDEAG